jgi:hypothetical protein
VKSPNLHIIFRSPHISKKYQLDSCSPEKSWAQHTSSRHKHPRPKGVHLLAPQAIKAWQNDHKASKLRFTTFENTFGNHHGNLVSIGDYAAVNCDVRSLWLQEIWSKQLQLQGFVNEEITARLFHYVAYERLFTHD